MIVLTVKLGVKQTEEGKFAEAIAATARNTETGEVAYGGFGGSRETIIGILKLLETNPEVRIKYE